MGNIGNELIFICGEATDQGEKSVVLLLLVVGGGAFFSLLFTVFWGVKRKNFVSKGVGKDNNFALKGV